MNKNIIPEFILKVVENKNESKRFKYASDEIGNRNKIGGKPKWIQNEEIVKCDDCGKEMTFYGQLDSINDEYCIADCGIIYVFICFDCNKSKSIIQSN